MKKEVVEERYRNCWWHSIMDAKTGTCKSERDWPAMYYHFDLH